MSTPTHLGRSPLSADLPVESGNPLFDASAGYRALRLALDELRSLTGVEVSESSTLPELYGLAEDHGLNLVGILEVAEARVAAEAVTR